ncbi:hypothetical protein TJA_23520 [Thermus sp. LT1-2-5]|uniref:hypothetical protein n=1 Tax=Thermus sp. LT1-2-5 TaxID=3026935 RepID=UPI0030E7917A
MRLAGVSLALLSVALAGAPLGKGLVVADAGNHRLVELSPEGQLVRTVPLPPPFRYTDDVFFAPGGKVAYITDPEVDAVGAVTTPRSEERGFSVQVAAEKPHPSPKAQPRP